MTEATIDDGICEVAENGGVGGGGVMAAEGSHSFHDDTKLFCPSHEGE